MTALDAVLSVCVAWLLYAYVGYPVLVAALAQVWRRPVCAADITPAVSLIIVARNEEAALPAKLENALGLDYPVGRLEVIVASDGSTDRTEAIAASFAARGVRLVHARAHIGKTETTNRAAEVARGEILVFSDATGNFARDALRALVRPLADPRVGVVSGRVAYRYADAPLARGFRLYQRWVVAARRAESVFGTETSVSGSICAVRRTMFRRLPPGLDFDLAHPLHAACAGLRTIYAADAELRARARMGALAYRFLPYAVRHLPRIRCPIYVLQLLSHKVARWLAPVPLAGLAIATLVLAPGSCIATLAVLAQAGVYVSPILVARLPPAAALARWLGPAAFFATANAGLLLGLWRLVHGQETARWEPER